jgi:hypothetical protein
MESNSTTNFLKSGFSEWVRKNEIIVNIYFFYLGMPLRKNFGSGRSLQSLFHFVPQRVSAATLHANPDLRLIMNYDIQF